MSRCVVVALMLACVICGTGATANATGLLPTRGVWANFEERGSSAGYFNGDLLQRFSAIDPVAGRTVSDEVADQLDAMRAIGINTVTFEIRTSDPTADHALNSPPNCGVPPALGVQWPQPTQVELAGLVAFFDLVHAKGMRVMLLLNSTHMDAPASDSATWIGAILGAIKAHPAFDFVTFGGDINVDNGACGIPAEPALWLGVNGVQSQYVKWAINYGMTTLGISPSKLSAEAIVGDYSTDSQDLTASGNHLWPPVYTLKQIFDSLAIPDAQRTYALSFYTRPKCYTGLSIPCAEIGRAAWADQMAQNVLRFVGQNTQSRIVAAEMGNYDSKDPTFTTDQAIATLTTVMVKYGFDGGSFWRWSTSVNSDETNSVFATPVVKRGATLDYYSAVRSALSAFFQPLTVGSVFSSAQAGSQSFLRFYNTGSNAGIVTVTLLDYATGAPVGQWSSPSIPAGAEQQFSIATVESGANMSAAPPAYYQLAVQTAMSGYFQHVLWRAADGTLSNISTCATGVTASAGALAGVHSSLLGSAFPSSVVVVNTGSSTEAATLDIHDARDGSKLGAYTIASIAAGAEAIVQASDMEAAIKLSPSAGMYHYVVTAETPFTGYLQNLVSNTRAGVTTDMTTACSLNLATSAAAVSPLQEGAVFSTAQSTSRSFLRFFNTSTNPGSVSVTLRDDTTGQTIGTWMSPNIPALSEQQFAISTVEAGANIAAAKPPHYTIGIRSGFSGYFQHVLFRPSDGTLTNLSTCGSGVTVDGMKLSGIHSSIVGGGAFPSSVVISNTGAAAETVTLDIYDARDGSALGTYTTASIPAGGQVTALVSDIEAAAKITPTLNMYHYVLKARAGFTGFMQNLVNNTAAGVITDMTTACAIAAAP